MTHQFRTTALDEIGELPAERGFDGLAGALRVLLDEVMKLESAAVLGAGPYRRAEGRTGHANGFKPKTAQARAGALTLAVPRTRGVESYPPAPEEGLRGERALELAVAEMYVRGASTRKVAAVTERLCGPEVTTARVSRAARALDEELERWRARPLGETPCLTLDARHEKARHGGQVRSCAALVAIGIDPEGKRSVPGVSASPSEAEVHRRDLPAGLRARGLHGVELVVSDAHGGLEPALDARPTGVPWQGCQFHPMKNALAFVPRPEMQAEVAADLRAAFDAPDRPEAERQLGLAVEKYRTTAPKPADWPEVDIPEGLAVFSLPRSHRRRLRTSNVLERRDEEMKRRTRVAGLLPDDAWLLRLVGAVLMGVGEDWETSRKYLTMGPA